MITEKVVGQTKHAGFEVGARKTFNVSLETAWDFLFSKTGLSTWLGEISPNDIVIDKPFKTKEGIEGRVTTLNHETNTRLTWKPKHWPNISSLQIRVIKSKDKSTISFHQDKLLDSKQREEMKQYWSSVLDKIGRLLSIKKT